MTPFTFKPSPFSINRRHAVALILSGLAMGGAQAQVFDFYVSETAASTKAATILNYSYDQTAGTTTLVGTYTPTGVYGGTLTNVSGLTLSGDKKSLSYSGFTGPTSPSGGTSKSTQLLFNLSSKTFDAGTTISSSGTIRTSYTQDGTTYYSAAGTSSPGTLVRGSSASAPTSIVLNQGGGFSANSIAYNGVNLYTTRPTASTTGGVWTPTTNGLGLVTTAVNFSQITGVGWDNTHIYDGLGFLGTDTLFAADVTGNTLSAFSKTSNLVWDRALDARFTLNLGTTSATNTSIQQLSVQQIDANNALVFFTTTDVVSGHTSTFDAVSYNTSTGFGSVTVLGSSTSQFFTGIASVNVVPEPGTYAMLGLGLGLLGLMTLRRKTSPQS